MAEKEKDEQLADLKSQLEGLQLQLDGAQNATLEAQA